MNVCGSCFGSGKVTCSTCGGRRQHARLTVNGDVDISTCLVCGGSGKVSCRICGEYRHRPGSLNSGGRRKVRCSICGGYHDRPGSHKNGDISAEPGRDVTDWILRRLA